jgi:hypothetical protein
MLNKKHRVGTKTASHCGSGSTLKVAVKDPQRYCTKDIFLKNNAIQDALNADYIKKTSHGLMSRVKF